MVPHHLQKAMDLQCGLHRKLRKVGGTLYHDKKYDLQLKKIMPLFKMSLNHFCPAFPDSLCFCLLLCLLDDRRRKGQQKIRWLAGITDSKDMGLSKFQELVMNREAWCAAVHEVIKSRTWLSDWTELNFKTYSSYFLRVSCLIHAAPLVPLIFKVYLINLPKQ